MTKRIFASRLDEAGGFLKKNRSLIVILLLFLLGILLGSWAISLSGGEYYGVDSVFENYLSCRSEQSFFKILFCSLISVLPLLILCYVLGMCAVGSAAAIIIPFARGFGIGLISGYLYSAYSITGIGFFSLVMLPGLFISSLVILLASRELFRFSLNFFKILLPGAKAYGINDDFRIYSAKFAVLTLILVLSSLTDSLLSVAFTGFFNF